MNKARPDQGGIDHFGERAKKKVLCIYQGWRAVLSPKDLR